MRKLVVLMFVVLCFGCCTSDSNTSSDEPSEHPPEEAPSEFYDKAREAFVKLEMHDKESDRLLGSGSGSVIEVNDDRYILTASHVCRPDHDEEVTVRADGVETNVVDNNIYFDVCALEVPDYLSSLPSLNISHTPPSRDMLGFVPSSPFGIASYENEFTPVTTGRFAGTIDFRGTVCPGETSSRLADVYLISSAPGSSGAPVIREGTLEVVGIVTHGRRGSDMYFISPYYHHFYHWITHLP